MWRFWPCAEITTHSEYRGESDFTPANNDLRRLIQRRVALQIEFGLSAPLWMASTLRSSEEHPLSQKR